MHIIAHRGASGNFPENTRAAFEQAASLPVYGVEFDVHLTKDQQLVIIHDETLERTSNGQGFVKDHTLEQLKQLDFGQWFHPSFKGQQILTLAELFVIFQHTHHILNIEIKTDIFHYIGIEQLVYEAILDANFSSRIVISSFNHESLLIWKDLNSNIPAAALFSTLVIDIEDYVKTLHCDAMHIEYYHTERKIIKKALKNGWKIRTFTVNNIDIAKYLKQQQVESIFTDFPELMSEHI